MPSNACVRFSGASTIVALAAVLFTMTAAAQDWPLPGRDMGRTSWTGPAVRFATPLTRLALIPVPKRADYLTYSRGVLYAAADGTPNVVSAIDVATGAVLWWDSVAASAAACDVYPAVARDVVLMGGQGGRGLHAFDRLTGALRWMKPMGSLYARQPAVDDSSAYVLRDSLWRIDLATGATRWVKPYAAVSSPALDASSVYACLGSSIAAIDKATGNLRWSIAHRVPSYPSIAVSGNLLYASSTDTVSAIAAATGVVLWTHALRGKTMARSATSCFGITDSVLCYVYENDTATGTGGIVALDSRSGAVRWTHPYRVAAASPLAIVDGVIYTTDWKTDMLRAIRLRDGQAIFTDSSFAYEYQPVFGDGVLYVAAGSGIVPFVPAGTGAAGPSAPRTPIAVAAAPNPFTAGVALRIDAAPDCALRVCVADALGRRVAVLHDGRSPGALRLHWDGRSAGGTLLPAGVYHVIAESDGGARQTPVVLVR